MTNDLIARTKKRSHRHFPLDAAKIKRAQKVLGAKTETETIELALDLAIAENRKTVFSGGLQNGSCGAALSSTTSMGNWTDPARIGTLGHDSVIAPANN
jgi:hypothetical protein